MYCRCLRTCVRPKTFRERRVLRGLARRTARAARAFLENFPGTRSKKSATRVSRNVGMLLTLLGIWSPSFAAAGHCICPHHQSNAYKVRHTASPSRACYRYISCSSRGHLLLKLSDARSVTFLTNKVKLASFSIRVCAMQVQPGFSRLAPATGVCSTGSPQMRTGRCCWHLWAFPSFAALSLLHARQAFCLMLKPTVLKA